MSTVASAHAPASTPNAGRQPIAVPSVVVSGTPSTNPTAAPAVTSDSARPVRCGSTSRDAYPMLTEKNTACDAPPSARAAATTANVGATATSTLLTV
ncbi:hypothetical protein CCE02nite_01060 [Cellulosimicrobium cellulans]|uniref:Uncharacterized protein n=1 Tax=Cellulosimicrobium cellulans TaxID=1710 RepID=A0A4Y4DTZ2_CELCE|nr:hypothetical protein [Cellulosimicrobium cellulans]GED08107.1 hypothetical protein CCE02nite_01060 [Cellulosimicrobium cellulans]